MCISDHVLSHASVNSCTCSRAFLSTTQSPTVMVLSENHWYKLIISTHTEKMSPLAYTLYIISFSFQMVNNLACSVTWSYHLPVGPDMLNFSPVLLIDTHVSTITVPIIGSQGMRLICLHIRSTWLFSGLVFQMRTYWGCVTSYVSECACTSS